MSKPTMEEKVKLAEKAELAFEMLAGAELVIASSVPCFVLEVFDDTVYVAIDKEM